MTPRLAVAAASCALLAACASHGHHVDERPAGYATPEPNPTCRGTVQQSLQANNLDYVSVKVSVTRDGRLAFLDILAPALTPSEAVEVRRAFEDCLWKPAVGPDGERTESTFTLAIRR